ncbi:MAG: sugar ABC transporter permease [Fimbriimonadaceae bacterium]|nr:sugar ABC transporter permease [Fimbriimonadaceae bacterium]
MTSAKKREAFFGVLFALPWLIGFSVFLIYPISRSIYYSFCDYSVLKTPLFTGMDNYVKLMSDEVFWQSLGNTLYFAFLSVPLGTIVSLALAMLLNTKVRGQAWYRTFFFLPSLIPAVPIAMLGLWLFNGEHGIINHLLRSFHIFELLHLKEPNWLGDPTFTKPVLIMMAIWAGGNAMVIYLAGLQEVPKQLYEASELDGASAWHKTRNVTIPLLSPIILFNVIMAIIGSLQYFTQAYVMFPGGTPARSTYFYTMYLFDNAFTFQKMGYACAMGWILFLIILVLSFGAFKFSQKRVYYEGS